MSAQDTAARIARTVVGLVRSMQAPDDLPPKTAAKEDRVEEKVQVMRRGVLVLKVDGLPAKKGTAVYLRADGTATITPGADCAVLGTVEQDSDLASRAQEAADVEVRYSVPAGCAAVRIGTP